MRFVQAAGIASALLKTRVFRRRVPLFAAWNITFRCNLHCQYCGARNMSVPELETQDVLAGLDQLWALGVRWITFGGGEPLIRDDIGEVLSYAKNKGFNVYLSTNGRLVSQKAKDLKGVDHVNLSLDGNREVHDKIRGQGAFDRAIASIEVFQRMHIPVSFLCVLSKYNLNQIHEVVDLAEKHDVLVMFQPATLSLNISLGGNPICPPAEDYRQVIASLINLKKKGAPIRNSITGLKHLSRWPDPTHIWCPAGSLMLVMEPDGSMNACRPKQFGNHDNTVSNIKKQFTDLKIPRNCNQCWCAPIVELSLALSLRPEALWNAFCNF